MSKIILVRHTEISSDWRKRCYGVADAQLSDAGVLAIGPVAEGLVNYNPKRVIHSGLSRTRMLAKAIACQGHCPMVEDTAFRELNFGHWEGRHWEDIFAEVGHTMSRMITEPQTFSPPEGETVYAVRDRVVKALLQVSMDGLSIIVTHGGPIAAVCGTLQNSPARSWPDLVPKYGTKTTLTHADLLKLQTIFQP